MNEIETKKTRNEVAEWLTSETLKAQIAQALPRICTPDRFMRVLFSSMQKTPALMKCTKTSLLNAFISCSQLGLEPDGRRAYLIPYGNVCTLIIDYKGLVELALRSGKISNIFADVVCENDEFEYDMGEVKRHKIDLRNPRGKMYAVYAICRFKDGTVQACVMSKEEVEQVRKSSKSANGTTWMNWYNEMAKKTAFKRLAKWLPLSPELRDAIDIDDKYDFEQIAKPEAPKVNTSKLFGRRDDSIYAEDIQGEVVDSPELESPNPPDFNEEPKTETKKSKKAQNAVDELNAKLAEEGLTEFQLIEYARRQQNILAGGKLDEFGASKILNAWDVVKGIIATMPKE